MERPCERRLALARALRDGEAGALRETRTRALELLRTAGLAEDSDEEDEDEGLEDDEDEEEEDGEEKDDEEEQEGEVVCELAGDATPPPKRRRAAM